MAVDDGNRSGRGSGWPESRSYKVRNVLLHVFREEWEHRLYAERDLDALAATRS